MRTRFPKYFPGLFLQQLVFRTALPRRTQGTVTLCSQKCRIGEDRIEKYTVSLHPRPQRRGRNGVLARESEQVRTYWENHHRTALADTGSVVVHTQKVGYFIATSSCKLVPCTLRVFQCCLPPNSLHLWVCRPQEVQQQSASLEVGSDVRRTAGGWRPSPETP